MADCKQGIVALLLQDAEVKSYFLSYKCPQ